jgi:hypothetical protein
MYLHLLTPILLQTNTVSNPLPYVGTLAMLFILWIEEEKKTRISQLTRLITLKKKMH